MNALLLGNGFDINYTLPTKYINFLNTVEFLSRVSPEWLAGLQTVGDVFKSETLQKQDSFIADSYQKYKSFYDSTALPHHIAETLAKLPKANLWCAYFLESFNRDIGWIDFEKEISTVVQAFKDFLADPHPIFSIRDYPKNPASRYIIRKFCYFLDEAGIFVYKIKDEYMTEEYAGSGIHVINTEMLIGRLQTELNDFAEALKLYLAHFVDNTVSQFPKSDWTKEWFARLDPDYVITFNYTTTFEHFLPEANTVHIHGKVSDKIVLGIDPNEDDDLDTADTTFISFKKYFQRITYGTDTQYMSAMKELSGVADNLDLTVMGHSLDVTDKDIIQALFSAASDIAILYHSRAALASYVAKLIELYGKSEFDRLKETKNLQFISLETELEDYIDHIVTKNFVLACL